MKSTAVLVFLLISGVDSFVVRPMVVTRPSFVGLAAEQPSRRRRKRKASEEPSSSTQPATPPPPPPSTSRRPDEAVQLEVQDIRDLIGGKKAPEPVARDDDDEEYEEYEDDDDDTPVAATNDALEQLLADARQMQALERSEAATEEEGGFSIPKSFSSALSTLLTVDFFVVCGFLLWFLAGVFCSYVLEDDRVQIAFNNQFQTLVQPALGLLMIGSIAGAFGDKEEDKE